MREPGTNSCKPNQWKVTYMAGFWMGIGILLYRYSVTHSKETNVLYLHNVKSYGSSHSLHDIIMFRYCYSLWAGIHPVWGQRSYYKPQKQVTKAELHLPQRYITTCTFAQFSLGLGSCGVVSLSFIPTPTSVEVAKGNSGSVPPTSIASSLVALNTGFSFTVTSAVKWCFSNKPRVQQLDCDLQHQLFLV